MSEVDEGKQKQIRSRLEGAILARDTLQKKVNMLGKNHSDAKSLRIAIAAYERDIKGYRRTLGIK